MAQVRSDRICTIYGVHGVGHAEIVLILVCVSVVEWRSDRIRPDLRRLFCKARSDRVGIILGVLLSEARSDRATMSCDVVGRYMQ